MRLSLCIPTYEPRPGHLAALLASIEAQAVEGLEIVVSDDTSTAEIDAPGARVVRQPEHLGMVDNWNAAVGLATGDLVMVLGQDDELGPGQLAAYLAELDAHPEVVAVSAGEVRIDDDGDELAPPRRPNHRSRVFVDRDRYELGQDDLVRLCLRNGNVYGEPSAVLFRRRAFAAVGGYRPEFGHVADIDLALRLAGEGPVAYLNRPLVRRRLHPAMRTRAQQEAGETAADRVRLHEAWIDHPGLTGGDRAAARAAVASWAARDAVKAALGGRWGAVRDQVRVAGSYGWRAPTALPANAWELVTAHNRDRR